MGYLFVPRTMRYFLFSVLFLMSVGHAQEPVVPPQEKLTPMLRASIFVRDLDESLRLYRDILGLKPRRQLVLDREAVNRVLGTRDQTVRLAILQSGDTLSGNVGLFSYVQDKPEPPPAARTDIRTGDTVFVFVTTDIHGIHAILKNEGYSIVSPPIVLFPNPDVEEQDLEMLFFDRDGVGINLIQRGQRRPQTSGEQQ